MLNTMLGSGSIKMNRFQESWPQGSEFNERRYQIRKK